MDSKKYWTLKELSSSVRIGKPISSSLKLSKGEYKIITPKNISNGLLVEYPDDNYISSINSSEDIIEIGDILISLVGPSFNACINESLSLGAIASSHIAIIKSNSNHYLNAFFNSKTGLSVFQKEAQKNSKGVVINTLSIKSLSEINIPYYPLEDLNQFVRYKLSNSDIYESEIAISLMIKLESLGWKVNREYNIDGRHRLDLALFFDGKLKTFIEIKRNSRNEFTDVFKGLQEQLNKYLSLTDCRYAYCFFDGNLFEFSNNKFQVLQNFPQPKKDKKVNNEHNLDYEFFKEILAENLALKKKFEELKSSNETLHKIYSDVQIIKSTTSRTEEKINSVLKILNNLSTDFMEVKTSNSQLDEKLLKLNIELENSLQVINENNFDLIAKYESLLENLFAFEWEKFENLSRSYLPAAEFLFDQLSKLENPDLSPFILQYCRALENEILQKIFRNYVQDIKNRPVNIDIDFKWDVSFKENGKPNNDNTFRLARHLKKCLNTEREKWFFELGAMHAYLQYLTGKTINKSPLLQDLRIFLFTYFEKNILEKEFLLRIKIVTEEFRNKSAHPNRINIDDAERGKKELRSILKDFLEMYNAP